MKSMTYALFGAGILAASVIGAAQSASADRYYDRDAPSPDAYRVYCEDPWYRQQYFDYCERYHLYDDYARYYGPPYQTYYDGYRYYPSFYFPYYYPGFVFGYRHHGYYGHRYWGHYHGGYGHRGRWRGWR